MPNQVLESRPQSARNQSTEPMSFPTHIPGTNVLGDASISSGMKLDDLRRELQPTTSGETPQAKLPTEVTPRLDATQDGRAPSPANQVPEEQANFQQSYQLSGRSLDTSPNAAFEPQRGRQNLDTAPSAGRSVDSAGQGAQSLETALENVRKAAGKQALSDFQRSPATTLDERTAGNTIDNILKRHPEIAANPEMREQVIKAFVDQYKTTFDRNFDSMNYFQRSYYGFTRQWNENISQIGDFVSRSVEAVQSIPSKVVGAAQAVKEYVGAAVEKGAELATSAYKTVTNPETWTSIGSNIATAVTTISDPRNWYKAAEWVATKTTDLAVGTWNAVTNIENWKAVGSAIGSGISAVATFSYDVLTNPAKAWETAKTAGKAVGGFLYEMGASTGVNDLIYGVYKAGEGIVRLGVVAPAQFFGALATNSASLLSGRQSFDQFMGNMGQATSESYGKAFQCLAESGKAVKGAVMLASEVTGVTDLAKAGYYLATGDFKMAAMHGAFAAMSAGSIAATFATGGVAVGTVAAVAMGRKTVMEGIKTVGKVALKEFAQEAAEKIGKETGEKIVKSMTAELGTQLETKVLQCTKNVVEKGVNEIAQQVEKHGRDALVGKVALQNVEAIMHKVGLPEVHNLLKELKVYDRVRAEAFDIAKNIDTSSVKNLAGQLEKLGMSAETSRTAAKQLKKAFKSGLSDDAIATAIAKEVTDEISNELIKHARAPFQDAMRSAFSGTLDTDAGKRLASAMEKHNIKLTKNEIDDLVDASWRGYERAIKEATGEVVLKAVKDGISDYRNSHERRGGFEIQEFNPLTTGITSEIRSIAALKPADEREAHKIAVSSDIPGKVRKNSTRDNTVLGRETIREESEGLS